MKAVIFLGPSLPLPEARKTLEDAIYLPPARQSDLLSATLNLKPTVIGLIDGVFLQTPAVWHKEILYALQRGVRVYGSSSMGALRAAETDVFGMVGVGEIYRQYASGEVIDDDEVALAHGPPEYAYAKLSEPMVNVRATLAAARTAGVLDDALYAQLISIAKEIYFGDRIFPVIFERAAAGGIPANVIDRLKAFIKSDYVDLKAADAKLLLETIRDLPPELEPIKVTHQVALTSGFVTMYNRDRMVGVDNTEIPVAQIANYLAVQAPDFAFINFNALNRALGVALARLLHVEVKAEETDAEAQRFRRYHHLETDSEFADWLEHNHLLPEEFQLLMKETAMCRHLHRWLIYARWTERTTHFLLNYLRWENSYEKWAKMSAVQQQLIDMDPSALRSLDAWRASTASLVEEHTEWSKARIDLETSAWAEEAGFHSKSDLKLELLRAKLARRVLLEFVSEAADDNSSEEAIPDEAADAAARAHETRESTTT